MGQRTAALNVALLCLAAQGEKRLIHGERLRVIAVRVEIKGKLMRDKAHGLQLRLGCFGGGVVDYIHKRQI